MSCQCASNQFRKSLEKATTVRGLQVLLAVAEKHIGIGKDVSWPAISQSWEEDYQRVLDKLDLLNRSR